MRVGKLLSHMNSEETLFALEKEASKAVLTNSVEQLYIIRSQMNEILVTEEKKPLDFHTDRYNLSAYLVCLDLFDFSRALDYAKRIKDPTPRVLRRIEIIKADIQKIEGVSSVISEEMHMAKEGTYEQIASADMKYTRVMPTLQPSSYGEAYIKVQMLKILAIIKHRLNNILLAISLLDEARAIFPLDIEAMELLLNYFKEEGNSARVIRLTDYIKRLSLDAVIKERLLSI